MRLVEDHHVVVGQHADAVATLAQTEVGEVEGVVRDHEVRVRRALARRLGEARAHIRTRPAETAIGADRKLRPERLGRLDLELSPVAGSGRVDPGAHRVEHAPVLGPREERPAEEREPLQPAAAEVVVPPLQHGDVHLPAERCRSERHVLRQQLLLQRLRGRGDNDAQARFERRDEVGKALARARGGLGEEMRPICERPRDRVGELRLLLPGLVLLEHPRERATVAEDVAHGSRA